MMFNRGAQLIEGMCNQHNKVLPIRCDIHFPAGYVHDGRNAEIKDLHKRLKWHFSYNGVDLAYITVREINKAAVPHYHIMVMVDGNKLQSPHHIWDAIEHIWNSIVGCQGNGLVHRCYAIQGDLPVPPLEMLRRPSSVATAYVKEQQQQSFERGFMTALGHLEYLAKTVTKGQAGKGNREYFASRARRE